MMKRVLYIDIIRILACLMIILIHAPIPNTGLGSYILSIDSLFATPGVGLFVMASGALLLPVNISTDQFLKKRFGKIVGPTIFWTVFYYLLAPYTETVNQGNGVLSFLSIPFSPQFNGVLWFMYMLAGLYLLSPILSGWLKNAEKWEVEFYLCLWGITLCYPLIREYVKVEEGHTGILYYFGGYVGYFLLGYYLNKYASMSIGKCLALLIFPFLIAIVIKLQGVSIDFYDMFWLLSIFVVMMAIGWFLLLKRSNVIYNPSSPKHGFIVQISNCCFGIYLIHIFVMRSILWNWPLMKDIEGGLQILLVTILTFLGSYGITWLISYLPWAEYIIGYRQKR